MKTPLKEFFLVALPGLEDLVALEVRDWYPDLVIEPGHGGVRVMAPLETGLTLNLVLKTPTRILLRVATFRCKDFPKLFQKVSEYPWREILHADCTLDVEVSSARSRLKIKTRIAETCSKAWRAYQKSVKAVHDPKKPATLFVRFADDECTLSLDTSGERLHKRGQRQNIGEAPLRETIAAALLQMIERNLPLGETREVEVIDPMMGSGTFLIEAALRDQPIHAREFAFASFQHDTLPQPILQHKRMHVAALIGCERDAKTLLAAKSNLRHIPRGMKLEVLEQDIFAAPALPPAQTRQRWLLANPPYGERLEVKEPLAEYYAKLFAACETMAQPDRACFILPAKAVKGRFELPRAWKVLEKRGFSNGGIPVIAFLFGRNGG